MTIDENENQLTWQAWADENGYSPTENGIKHLVGDLGKFGLDLAASLMSDGYEVIGKPDAAAAVVGN